MLLISILLFGLSVAKEISTAAVTPPAKTVATTSEANYKRADRLVIQAPNIGDNDASLMSRMTSISGPFRTNNHFNTTSNNNMGYGVGDKKDPAPGLSKLVADFRADLWPELPTPPSEWYKQWARLPGEPLHRRSSTPVSWHPVLCKTIGLEMSEHRVISEGNANTVYLVRDKRTAIQYIYKVYSSPDEAALEQHALSVMDHPFIVKPICHLKEEDRERGVAAKYGLVLEYIEGAVSSQQWAQCCATEADLQRMAGELLVALEYIHWMGFIHADMKPKNVMIRPDGHICVIDFGFSTWWSYGRKGRGTPATISPEAAMKYPGDVHQGVDWWAFGVTVAMWYGARLRAVQAAQAAQEADIAEQQALFGEDGAGEKAGRGRNVMNFLPKIQAIRAEPDFTEDASTTDEEDGSGSSVSLGGYDPNKRYLRKTYVPIGLKGKHYERQPTPEGFSPDLRRFLFIFFSLNPDERRFDTVRLQQALRLHPFFRPSTAVGDGSIIGGVDWSSMPSPLALGTEGFLATRPGFIPMRTIPKVMPARPNDQHPTAQDNPVPVEKSRMVQGEKYGLSSGQFLLGEEHPFLSPPSSARAASPDLLRYMLDI